MRKSIIIVGMMFLLLLTLEINYNSGELENTILKPEDLPKLKSVSVSYEIINASVVSRKLFDWFNTLVIDKGSNDGIEEGDVVTNNGALIGIIIEVTPNTSVVRLITDNQNKVSAKILDDEVLYGLICEYKDGFLTMEGLKSYNIEIGNKVVTTGMSYIYPASIYIGEVFEITYDELGLNPTVLVKTPVDFNNILYVSVLKR